MIAALVVIAMLAAMTGLGLPMVRLLGAGLTEAERWLASLLVGALPLALAIQVVGWWHYSLTAMAGVLALSLVPAAWSLRNHGLMWPSRPRGPVAMTLLMVIVLLLGLAALSAFGPPTDHDTLRYHLTLPRRDLELGHIRPWFGWSAYEFFPPLGGLLTRLAFSLGGASAAQLLNVAWAAAAAAAAGLLVRRLGGGHATALAGATLFLAQRVVVNLSGAVTTDMQLAACLTAALMVGLAMLEKRHATRRTALLLGLLLGTALCLRYQAAIAVAAILLVLSGARRSPLPFVPAGLVAAALLLPVLVRNALITGNPVFPTFHPLFVADAVDLFNRYQAVMAAHTAGTGGFGMLPWAMHIDQNGFDGLQFGFPFALIAIPFAFAAKWRGRLICLAVWGLYVVAWWFTMPHLLRFHLPVLAIVAALTALGLARVMEVARTLRGFAPIAGLFLVMGVGLQSLFVASTAAYRLPPALGLLDKVAALEAPAFVFYSLGAPCHWLEARLQPGERYLALVNDPSFHCPQAAAMHQLEPGEETAYYGRTPMPPVGAGELAARLEARNVRYILVAPNPGTDDEPLMFAKHRYDALVLPLLPQVPPLFKAPSGNVYDAAQVIAALRDHLINQASPAISPPHPRADP